MPDSAEQKQKIKWYFKPTWVLVAILAIGPLAIPLVWRSPAFKRWQKIVITVLLALLTIWIFKAGAALYNALKTEMQELQDVLKQ